MPNQGFKVFSAAFGARLSHPETQNPCILLGLLTVKLVILETKLS